MLNKFHVSMSLSRGKGRPLLIIFLFMLCFPRQNCLLLLDDADSSGADEGVFPFPAVLDDEADSARGSGGAGWGVNLKESIVHHRVELERVRNRILKEKVAYRIADLGADLGHVVSAEDCGELLVDRLKSCRG